MKEAAAIFLLHIIILFKVVHSAKIRQLLIFHIVFIIIKMQTLYKHQFSY